MKQPKLRFPEFTEDWIPYKLNNICEKITDGSHHSPSEVKNGYPMPSVKNMLPNGFDIENSKKISKHDYELLCSQGCKPEIGDVVVAKDGSVLKYAFEIKKSEPIVILSSIAIMKPNHSILDGKFLAQSITVPHFKERIIAENTTGTGVPRIVLANFKNIFISLPKIEEQQKIASLFTELDVLIQSAEKELEGYRELKQGMLQKMFPKKGETVPEIRFPEFSGDWELCKLGDIGSVSMCRRIFKGQTTESGDIPFYKIGTFGGKADAYISKDLFEEYKTKYPFPKIGDILISASGSIGRTVEFNGESAYFQDSNIVWLNHDERVDNSFLKQFYSIVKWSGLEGSAIKRLYNDNILKTEISLPSLDEQKKIGNYFSNLDNLIASQQQELDGYKELKKGLLQQMFC